MKIWLRRLGYTAVFLLWCTIMLLPTVLCVGLADGQMIWGDDPNNQMRLFLMQEAGQEGIGLQWTRPATDDGACIQTSVRYLMIDGEAENNDLCTCLSNPTEGPIPAQCQAP